MTWEKSDRRSPRRRWRSRRRPFKSRNRRTVPMTTCRATQGMPASSDAAAAAALLQIVQYLRPQLPPTPSCPSSWIEGGRWTLTCDASKPASACSSLPSYAIIPPPPSPPACSVCLASISMFYCIHLAEVGMCGIPRLFCPRWRSRETAPGRAGVARLAGRS